ncbi:exopolysaccharide biosynthesis protein [Bdellovibrio bacteriovorus]|uniref:exopolysaccharide biosynthesis protein n=1 Tax=Bdellovibrio bacteriovorus TaxID=959 RepID=UPI0021CFBD41|nr:exopolysaccharide biosynthesis protein [Bdellovibrio bacteriovorus]UXR63764.1 exopolysaccharide biosynthesis protein [Bdellovibrio bacteriovorus]
MASLKSRFISAMDLLQEEASKGDLTLRRVFVLLGEEGHAVLVLFLCLPFMQPIPIPGLSTPLGILISLVAIFLFRQRAPWLPKRFENLKISADVVIKVSEVAEKIWTYVSRVVKERLTLLHDFWAFRFINLVVFIGNAVLLSLPLPIPFSNTVPAIGIILCAIGHMEKDGVFILFSYLWCLIVASFFATLAMGAIHFV